MDRIAITTLLRHSRALIAAEDWRGALEALDRATGSDDDVIRAMTSGAQIADDYEPRQLIEDALGSLRSGISLY